VCVCCSPALRAAHYSAGPGLLPAHADWRQHLARPTCAQVNACENVCVCVCVWHVFVCVACVCVCFWLMLNFHVWKAIVYLQYLIYINVDKSFSNYLLVFVM